MSLSNWKLQYRAATGAGYSVTYTFSIGAKIRARGYYLLALSGTSYVGPIADGSYTLAMGAAGGHVRLVRADNTTVEDTVGYGTAVAPEGSPITGVLGASGSYERKAVSTSTAATMAVGGSDANRGNGRDSENNASDFVLRSTRLPQNSASATEVPVTLVSLSVESRPSREHRGGPSLGCCPGDAGVGERQRVRGGRLQRGSHRVTLVVSGAGGDRRHCSIACSTAPGRCLPWEEAVSAIITFDDTLWPLLILRIAGTMSDKEYADFLARSSTYVERGEPYVSITDLGQVGLPSAAQRVMQAEWTRKHEAEAARAGAGQCQHRHLGPRPSGAEPRLPPQAPAHAVCHRVRHGRGRAVCHRQAGGVGGAEDAERIRQHFGLPGIKVG